jgi:enamine deaminase RidA (YjgF/YER057c/UK114 family)
LHPCDKAVTLLEWTKLENSMKKAGAAAMAVAILVGASVHAGAAVKHIQNDKMSIATGVWAGDTFYLSGMVCCEVTRADIGIGPAAPKETPEVYGDTRMQAARVFAKIQKALQDQGLDMKDVVKLTVFLAPDPKTGTLDFAGMQSEYLKYFGTPTQPNKPARSAFQVAALGAPWALVEIETISVRSN